MSDREIVARLLHYAKPYWKNFIAVFFIMLFSIGYDLVSPLLVGHIEETIKDSFALSYLLSAVAVYAGILAKEDAGSNEDMLEALYLKFNIARPHDFTGHSMSVSDVIALRMDGKVTAHYVDSVGFHELPDFFQKEHLKNADMDVEDDYGMIDGIINNGRKQDEKKPSILGQLQGMKPIASDAQKKRERITHDR